ncbi:unnamed protein product [Ilex paraguariensis]|uniref:Uncharacterized protein n=1 Tax=Ilex paraguariensis TaxID=185542 RepID=A0ABC8QZB0_9AQUA
MPLLLRAIEWLLEAQFESHSSSFYASSEAVGCGKIVQDNQDSQKVECIYLGSCCCVFSIFPPVNLVFPEDAQW